MTPDELRQKYIDFFVSRGHAHIPSSSLVPENDPTTLFTGSGMQPLIHNLLGEQHPSGTRLVNSQKCFRSEDIEEVGDNRHTTFFEMLGNWSLGDYFKQDQLPWFFEFLTDVVGLDPNKLFVTVFSGDKANHLPRDDESVEIWKKLFKSKNVSAKVVNLGSEASCYKYGLQGGRIFHYDASKNWWSRAGIPDNMPPGEPGGPDSEVFYDFGTPHDKSYGPHCHPNCDCGRFLEIGNSVFMEYKKEKDGRFSKLPNRNVDFGGGFIRILAAKAHDPDVFNTDLFTSIIRKIEIISSKSYQDKKYTPSFRVIADHLRAAVKLTADGTIPDSKQQGYFSRRLIRRSVRHGKKLGIDEPFLYQLVDQVAKIYQHSYPEVKDQQKHIETIIKEEETKFLKTLDRGLKEFEKYVTFGAVGKPETRKKTLDVKSIFNLYQTYGFPYELSKEEADARGVEIPSREEFDDELEQHKKLSRTQSAGTFKGGLADHSDTVIKLHTATHLLHAALRNILGNHVRQEGSHITGERLRFDFTHPEKLTDNQIRQIEKEINNQVKANLKVTKSIQDRDKALASGALAFFKQKYPDKVSVYTIGNPDKAYSKEFCGGPHVSSTAQIGTVTITRQESIGAGKRRLYATIPDSKS